MVVEVGPEIEQFILQICTRPEQHVIQIFASNGANEPFHEGMRLGNVGDGLDFCHLQDPQIGLPLVELIERIMVGAEVLWQPALTSNGAVKHATECDPIDRASMDAETNDPSRGLIHNHQDPVGAQGYRLTAEQIHTPEAFFHGAEESQPGRPARALSRPVVMGENPSNHVLVDCKVEGQGDRFSDSRTTPAGIALLHFDDRMDEFCTRSLRAGLAIVIG